MVRTRTKTKKRKQHIRSRTYKKKHFTSNEGMVTSVWGPPLWHFLHTMSFNYPVNPTVRDKRHYRSFICSLQHILPCRYCRENLNKNLKVLPLRNRSLRSRDSFSRWMFKLHELVNTMLGKKSGLRYCDVRERYEHFRSRCTTDKKFSTKKIKKALRKTRKKERGCTEPLYGRKSKCIVKIVPKDDRVKSFQMDKKCIKKRT